MNLQAGKVKAAAERILADYDAGRANDIFAKLGTGWLTVEDAYEVQRVVAELRRKRGEQCLGYKVGCISPIIQKQFGLNEPVRGYIWKTEALPSGSKLRWDSKRQETRRFVNFAIEGEIGLRLARDISPGMHKNYLVDSVDAWFPVIELHNYVFRGPQPTSQELVAGNAMHAGFVAPPISAAFTRQLTNQAKIEISVNGDLVEAKSLADIPGGPLGSVRWLASSLARTRETLKAGEIVLTGSPGRLISLAGNNFITVTCDLQRVELTVESSMSE